MTVKIKLFAKAKEIAGQEIVELTLPEKASVGDLRTALCEQFPIMASLVPHLLIAVNNEYADDSFKLNHEITANESPQIACFPPVSGG